MLLQIHNLPCSRFMLNFKKTSRWRSIYMITSSLSLLLKSPLFNEINLIVSLSLPTEAPAGCRHCNSFPSISVACDTVSRRGSTSETQGQRVGARESLNGRKNMTRRKVKNGEKSPWGQCLTRPVLNGSRRSAFWLVPENSCVFFVPYFSARLDFPAPPLSAPGSPRMGADPYSKTVQVEIWKMVWTVRIFPVWTTQKARKRDLGELKCTKYAGVAYCQISLNVGIRSVFLVDPRLMSSYGGEKLILI